jgi:hypothetical protein
MSRYEQLTTPATKAPNDSTSPARAYWKLVKPEVFSRHLHTAIYGWWKDSNGVYFDSFVQ